MDYFEQLSFGALERTYSEPPDIDEVLPYDDWWYTLEDLNYESTKEDELTDVKF